MSQAPELETQDETNALVMAAEIVAAYASHNQMSQSELPDLIRTVHATLQGLSGETPVTGAEATLEAQAAPAVPIDASVGQDEITCLECGKGFKTLKRHLSSEHGLSPADYRTRWQLSKDYPLVAPSYSKRRAATAKKIGLGRKPQA